MLACENLPCSSLYFPVSWNAWVLPRIKRINILKKLKMPLFCASVLAGSLLWSTLALGDLPKLELTAEIKGLSGNTGGVPITGGKLRYDFVEANVLIYDSTLHAGIGVRRDFDVDFVVVPHIFAGMDILPSLVPILGLGLELLTPPVSFIADALRVGVRLDQYAYIDWSTGEVDPLVTLGVTCHF